MDKLDDDINKLKKIHQPRASFVADTMKNIRELPMHSQKPARKTWIFVLSPILAVFILFFAFSNLLHHSATTTNNSPNSSTTSSTQSNQTPSTQPTTATIVPGTDDASLQADLNSVNTSITKSQQSLDNANSAINDQQNQIAVPTN